MAGDTYYDDQQVVTHKIASAFKFSVHCGLQGREIYLKRPYYYDLFSNRGPSWFWIDWTSELTWGPPDFVWPVWTIVGEHCGDWSRQQPRPLESRPSKPESEDYRPDWMQYCPRWRSRGFCRELHLWWLSAFFSSSTCSYHSWHSRDASAPSYKPCSVGLIPSLLRLCLS